MAIEAVDTKQVRTQLKELSSQFEQLRGHL
jgi:hypothetical protein